MRMGLVLVILWIQQGSDLWPFRCERNALPLSYGSFKYIPTACPPLAEANRPLDFRCERNARPLQLVILLNIFQLHVRLGRKLIVHFLLISYPPLARNFNKYRFLARILQTNHKLSLPLVCAICYKLYATCCTISIRWGKLFFELF